MTYSVKAPAKINFALDVLGKRPDGYHDVAMIMQTIALYDTINVNIGGNGIKLTSDSSAIPTDETNIAYRAAHYLSKKYNINVGVHIHIEKRIPVAAGLAGGSTDAAAVFKLLNKAWDLGLSKEELRSAGEKLGADVPFCIQGGTCLAEGLGEKLTIIDTIPNCYIVLAKPSVQVSTKEVYQSLKLDEIIERPDIPAMLQGIKEQNLKEICSKMGNVLETVTTKLHPIIPELKQKLMEFGAMGSLMSGSGPTVFGIFENMSSAQAAYNNMKTLVNEVFIVKTFNGRDE
ncbi:MAG: 4-(cytidine 5'-diphospho)-2-C-methyl-D-erythritol kinase [Clostridiales bacterium GWB2_37_7]|nr:MAG: 4-(cytidine 5'-diphospho)-2-C-methyl-D-erythritol kinase [Clostridiales bacterium GWB2_37_7]